MSSQIRYFRSLSIFTVRLSSVHTTKFSLTCFPLTNCICLCVQHKFFLVLSKASHVCFLNKAPCRGKTCQSMMLYTRETCRKKLVHFTHENNTTKELVKENLVMPCAGQFRLVRSLFLALTFYLESLHFFGILMAICTTILCTL